MFNDQINQLRAWIQGEPLFKVLQEAAEGLGSELFLTGGLVRDRLLNHPTQDVDLAVSRRALPLAADFAERTGGHLVLLKEKEETARVVLPNVIFDLAGFRAPTLEGDLRHRDFTINSIALGLSRAWDPGPWEPCDPLGGVGDLGRRLIRPCGPDVFIQDPLRLLRVYRLAGQLQFEVAEETRQAVRRWGPALDRAAAERRAYEWIRLLAQPKAYPALALMDADGLLDILLPEMIPLRTADQNGYHHLNVRDHTLLAFQKLEEILRGEFPLPPVLAAERDRLLHRRSYIPRLKWAVLGHDWGKPTAAVYRENRRTFYRHEQAGRKLFEALADRFRLSRLEKDAIGGLISSHMRPFHLLTLEAAGRLTDRARLRFVRDLAEDLSGVFLLALADSLAASGPEKPPDLEPRLVRLWEESRQLLEATVRPLASAPPLVSGDDLIQLGLKPGPVYKQILHQTREKQWLGLLNSRDEALAWVRRRWGHSEP